MQHSGTGWISCQSGDFRECGLAGHRPFPVEATAIYAVRRPDASGVSVTFSTAAMQALGMQGTRNVVATSMTRRTGIFFG
jgi:hypothetical protein